MYSSNIGSARLAMEVGGKAQRDFLDRIGLLSPSKVELPEVGSPLVPDVWRQVSTMTIGFGHGIAVGHCRWLPALPRWSTVASFANPL